MKFRILLLFVLIVSFCFSSVFVSVYASSVEPVSNDISLVSVADRGFSDLASWHLDTNLGSLTLYCPIGVNSNGIVVIDNSLVNLTNSTVYFYSPQFPDYTFSASRFSPVYYRSDNYGSQRLVSSSVSRSAVNVVDYFDYVVPFALLAILLVCIWGGIKK